VIPKKDRLFYPSVFESAFAWLSMVVFTGMSFVLVMDEIFNTALFGA
jgi:hypothetical protein